jgi:hypothetical protein
MLAKYAIDYLQASHSRGTGTLLALEMYTAKSMPVHG